MVLLPVKRCNNLWKNLNGWATAQRVSSEVYTKPLTPTPFLLFFPSQLEHWFITSPKNKQFGGCWDPFVFVFVFLCFGCVCIVLCYVTLCYVMVMSELPRRRETIQFCHLYRYICRLVPREHFVTPANTPRDTTAPPVWMHGRYRWVERYRERRMWFGLGPFFEIILHYMSIGYIILFVCLYHSSLIIHLSSTIEADRYISMERHS